jgi:hypothetical protein
LRKVFVEAPTEKGVTKERFCAQVVEVDTARIRNIPFVTDVVAFDDLVRVDESGNVIEVLERTTRTRRASYDAASDRKAAKKELKAICEHMRACQIECESAAPGLLAMAVPVQVRDEAFLQLCKLCPVPLNPPR